MKTTETVITCGMVRLNGVLLNSDFNRKFQLQCSRGLVLESPENFSGSKSQLSNCNPLVLKS